MVVYCLEGVMIVKLVDLLADSFPVFKSFLSLPQYVQLSEVLLPML